MKSPFSILRPPFLVKTLVTTAVETPSIIKEFSDHFGSQSIVVSIDSKKSRFGHFEVFTHSGTRATGLDPKDAAYMAAENGAEEILLTSIDRDGTYQGYDLELVQRVTRAVNVPVIACGGAGKASDLIDVIQKAGAAAAAAGSLFVYHGPFRAVLINTPSFEEIEELMNNQKG